MSVLLWGSGFWVQGSRFKVQGSGFRVLGLGFKVLGSRFKVLGAGFKVLGAGFPSSPCGLRRASRVQACPGATECGYKIVFTYYKWMADALKQIIHTH
jgi:hypothetical protein